ncbi:MAG: hypothetical protein JXR58_02655, partial [Bacteroidales bacterium]|nr:hypothetical protein [Bacteroidales bacterium]
MKRILTSLLLIISFLSYSQNEVGTREQIETFFKTTTLVVVDDNPLLEYNMEIKEAIEKSWKITEYKFISRTEYEEKRKDANYSFITLDDAVFEKDQTKAEYTFMCLSLGGNYKTSSEMPQLCTVPLSYKDVDEETYAYKIGTLINFVQNHMLLTSQNTTLKGTNIIGYYNKNISSIKDKTLYLVKEELGSEVNTEKKIKEVYPYKFKLVEREEIEEAIDRNDDSVVFLHKVGPTGTQYEGRCYK